MKLIIDFNEDNKEQLKRLVERDNIAKRIISVVENEADLCVVSYKGRTVYTITVEREDE